MWTRLLGDGKGLLFTFSVAGAAFWRPSTSRQFSDPDRIIARHQPRPQAWFHENLPAGGPASSVRSLVLPRPRRPGSIASTVRSCEP